VAANGNPAFGRGASFAAAAGLARGEGNRATILPADEHDGRREKAMTARVLRGSKQQIAEQVASLPGEVREAIVFIDEPVNAPKQPVPATVEELFREMEPYMAHSGGAVDYSREAIYTPKPRE
jgi:hypothetical protein